jgi:hypothetical protein
MWFLWNKRKSSAVGQIRGLDCACKSARSEVDHSATIEIPPRQRAPQPRWPGDARATVIKVLDELRHSVEAEAVPALPVVDRLIDIWALASRIDPAASRTVERVLSAVAGREVLSADEVYAGCDQIETAVAITRRAYAA